MRRWKCSCVTRQDLYHGNARREQGSKRTLRKEAPVTVATRAIARPLDKGSSEVEVGCWIGPRPAPESAAPLSSGSWTETGVFSGSVVVDIGTDDETHRPR
jgi:hypothetical protein